MSDTIPNPTRTPTPERPLTGLTVLLVEDSRFASEAVRLLCLRSGARIRRADCLASADRHLKTYRPSIAIVDMGLPDGSGGDLIAEIRGLHGPHPVILGTSGDTALKEAALAAGANGFLDKPIESLALFQDTILSALPEEMRPLGWRPLADLVVEPDPLALRDDLQRLSNLLHAVGAGMPLPALPYAAHFLSSVARSAHDAALGDAAQRLGRRGGPSRDDMTRVTELLDERIAAAGAF
ncbi:response regulator [Thioclava nitratireducens]|uniref:Response regulator n=1 Tax=Thioclava nitratireducens TaxID=1915078 RepID=A0ABM6IKE7_9RHOB|nr:response regulator [Thioclava nitratireducens]AQS49173.1 response regulator [Thioclava nitratireducens]